MARILVMIVAVPLAALACAAVGAAQAKPKAKPVCTPDQRVYDYGGPTTAAQLLAGPEVGLVKVTRVWGVSGFSTTSIGMAEGRYSIKVLVRYRGAGPQVTGPLRFRYVSYDDHPSEGFPPHAGHVYLYTSLEPSEETWRDLENMACTPLPLE